MNYLHTIFGTMQQPVQLFAAILLFTHGQPQRKRGPLWAALAFTGGMILINCGLAYLPFLADDLTAFLWWSISIYLIFFAVTYMLYDVRPQIAAYFTTLGYLVQHIAFCAWDALLPGAGYNQCEYNTLLDVLRNIYAPVLIFCAAYAVLYLAIARPLAKRGYNAVSVRYSLVVTLAVLLLSIVFSSIVQSSFQHQNYLYRCCRIYAMICCILILGQQVSFQNRLAQQEEMALQKQLWMRHQAQYERASDSVKLINHKCHALKRQLAELKPLVAQSGGASETAVLQEMEKSVSVYDSIVETGNEILDTILTEKSLLCAAQDITFTCVADGKAVGFLEAVDLFSMLGNALDNAEEAVKKLTDHDRRAISVSIFASHGIAIMQVENFYDGTLTFEDGLPVTTKGDPNYHGFGLKSIRSTTEKYGGTLSIQADSGLFLLRIALPIEH